MPDLSYFAEQFSDKPHWLETPEGFRIYLDVPIARTGVQQYTGAELQRHAHYDSAWNLDAEALYEVHRDAEEVLHPDTLRSFEGKSVLDGHPPETLTSADDDLRYARGHIQNVRQGPMDANGNGVLLADVHVKDPELNSKIERGIREVSCGYTHDIARDGAGRLLQRNIRGNHLAVVPKGRAGRGVAIIDSAPPEPTPTKKGNRMSAKAFKGWLLKLAASAQDAEPEDVERLSTMLHASTDAKAKDAEEKEEKGEKDSEARCADCSAKLSDKKAKDKKAKDAKEDEEEKKSADAKKDEEEEEEEEEGSDDDASEVEGGKSVLGSGDSASFLDMIKPLVAKSKDKAVIAAYNKQIKARRTAATDDDPLALLAYPATGASADAQAQPSYLSFFNGRSYADGMKAYEAHQAQKGAK